GNLVISLGQVGGLSGTNIQLQVQGLQAGTFEVSAEIESTLPDDDPSRWKDRISLQVLPAPVLLFDDLQIPEGARSPGPLFVHLSSPAPTDLVVAFTLTPITAQPQDFFGLNSSILFRAGSSTVGFRPVQDDTVPEMTETARITFSSGQVSIPATSSMLEILNDDFPEVRLNNLSVDEGQSGLTSAAFTITLSSAPPFPIDLPFQVVSGTALSGEDFVAKSGTLRFGPGETSKSIIVAVAGDTLYELNETAVLRLFDSPFAYLSVPQAVLTIRNDDGVPAPRLQLVISTEGKLELRFETVAGPLYRIFSRTNIMIGDWQFVREFPGTGQPFFQMIDSSIGPQQYFRVSGQ
ncbi:MAG: Calx-beta domain-containing protein, partial [Verrucomicrobiota bacterium]